MDPGIESNHEFRLRLLAAVIEHDRIFSWQDFRTLHRVFQAARRDGGMITGHLRGIGIAQVPLEAVHARLNGGESLFLFLNLLIGWLPAVVHLGGSVLLTTGRLCFARLALLFFFLLLLLLGGFQVQHEAVNYFSLGIRNFESCRRFAVIVLRNVEEDGCAEGRVIARVGWPPSFGARNTVIVGEPSLLGSKKESCIR